MNAWKLRTLLMALVVSVAVGARAEVDRDFLRVPALEGNVAFWKRVYIEWSLNDIALSDDEDLGLVYRVVKVPPRGEKNAQGLTRPDVVKRAQAEVVDALRQLQHKNPTSEAGLVGVEREVYLNLKHVTRADKYARGARIRAQNGLRERFLQGWANSGMYEAFIQKELRDNGLPEELIGVAFVESLFYVGAKSKVGAAGIWQFMSYTGKEYMFLNGVVDERWDPILATEAAAKYLKQAKKELGTWPLAITSYNYGRAGMKALSNGAGTKDFGVILAVSKNKRFGFAARNYYASFLAVYEILKSKDRYLAGVQRKPAWSYDVIRLPYPVYSAQLERAGVDGRTLDALNPALTSEASRGRVPLPYGMSIRVPRGSGNDVVARLNALPESDRAGLRATRAVHACNGAQTLSDIAKKYGVPGEMLVATSGLQLADRPQKGQRLPIPQAHVKTSLLPEARGMALPPPPSPVRILLADATPVVEEKPPERVAVANVPPPLPRTPKVRTSAGVVIASRVLAEPIDADDTWAVDVVAGQSADLGGVDAMVGIYEEAPAPAATVGEPVS